MSGCGRSIWPVLGSLGDRSRLVRGWLRRLRSSGKRLASDGPELRPAAHLSPGAGHVAVAQQLIPSFWSDLSTPAPAGAPPPPLAWGRAGGEWWRRKWSHELWKTKPLET